MNKEKLPEEFTARMKKMLGADYDAFLVSYDKPHERGLRLNPLKTDEKEFLSRAPFALERVPWAKGGYYYGGDDAPGKHPYHDAGVYYIQEPSAMIPAAYLDAKPGERVLDLCAAPGGKSTQIAGAMAQRGVLVCNEIHPARAKILSENIERFGVRNAIVTNETPERLSERFTGYFDKILVDAPCSGEGMFRKNEDACAEWSTENVRACAARQAGILDCAAKMLGTGGRIVYSTCTFSPEENEGSVSRFLERHPDFSVVEVPKFDGMRGGVPEWTKNPAKGIGNTVRLFLHEARGEGHYAAVLQKAGTLLARDAAFPRVRGKSLSEADFPEFLEFERETLNDAVSGEFLKFGDQLYLLPEGAPSVDGLRALRPGLHLGTCKKNRFEPSHALALTLSPRGARHVYELSSDGGEIFSYLNGQTLAARENTEKGWYLVTVDGYSVGWGKLSGGLLKNHYPRGLRR